MSPRALVNAVFWPVLLAAGVMVGAASRPAGNAAGDWSLRYTVRPVPGGDFQVHAEARGFGRDKPTFRILNGWGLLQDQGKHVTEVAARDAAGRDLPLERVSKEGETGWKLKRAPRGDLVLTYRVRPYDPYVSPEASFTDAERFLLLGYSMFLFPREVGVFDPVDLRVVVDAPEGWPVWASWNGGQHGFAPGSGHELWGGTAAGGAYRRAVMASGTVRVDVLTETAVPALWGTTLANRLFPVLREMVSLFGAPPENDSLTVLSVVRVAQGQEHQGMVSGNSEEGAFLCLAAPDRLRDAEALTVVAVHECLHFYLGGAFTPGSEPPYRNAPDLIWLMEGVTEYLTFRLLERSGIFTPSDVERAVRRKVRSLEEEEARERLTLAACARRMDEIDVYERVYTRGYLVAELLDREMEIRGGPGAFEGALRDLFEEDNYYREGVLITPKRVYEVFERRAPGIRAVIRKYAEGDGGLPPRSEALAVRP
jgi:predicted metalloprotease with PDZ domain